MDDKQKSKEYFDGHSSTFVNRNGYWNYDYRMTSRILENNGTVVINELTGPKWLRRFMNRWFTKWPTGDHAVYSGAEMEQMLHAAGFQNIRSGMITPFSYVSVGRKIGKQIPSKRLMYAAYRKTFSRASKNRPCRSQREKASRSYRVLSRQGTQRDL